MDTPWPIFIPMAGRLFEPNLPHQSAHRAIASSLCRSRQHTRESRTHNRPAERLSTCRVSWSKAAWTNLLAKHIYLEAPVELEIIQTEGRTRFTDARAGSAAARPPSISQAQSNFRILELLGRHLALASLHQTTTRSSTRSSTKSWAWHRGIRSRTSA